jgi:hypothetical protein
MHGFDGMSQRLTYPSHAAAVHAAQLEMEAKRRVGYHDLSLLMRDEKEPTPPIDLLGCLRRREMNGRTPRMQKRCADIIPHVMPPERMQCIDMIRAVAVILRCFALYLLAIARMRPAYVHIVTTRMGWATAGLFWVDIELALSGFLLALHTRPDHSLQKHTSHNGSPPDGFINSTDAAPYLGLHSKHVAQFACSLFLFALSVSAGTREAFSASPYLAAIDLSKVFVHASKNANGSIESGESVGAVRFNGHIYYSSAVWHNLHVPGCAAAIVWCALGRRLCKLLRRYFDSPGQLVVVAVLATAAIL